MLLCACATGRLYERVELDAEPLVEVTSEGVKLDLLEIKAQPSGGWARKRGKVVVVVASPAGRTKGSAF